MKSEMLEALPLDELYLIAERIGLDLPRGLERVFVVEELIEALTEDSEDRPTIDAELHVDEKKYSGSDFEEIDRLAETALHLPECYNETMIRAMVRDSAWAFAYWDLADIEVALHDHEEEVFFLRVTELPASEDSTRRQHYDIPVKRVDRSWYINLPHPGLCFRVDLCARRAPGLKTKVLARSNEIESPRQALQTGPANLNNRSATLLRLSGIDSLSIATPSELNPNRLTPAWMELQAGDGD